MRCTFFDLTSSFFLSFFIIFILSIVCRRPFWLPGAAMSNTQKHVKKKNGEDEKEKNFFSS
jgi:hypothetical protein